VAQPIQHILPWVMLGRCGWSDLDPSSRTVFTMRCYASMAVVMYPTVHLSVHLSIRHMPLFHQNSETFDHASNTSR